jgi:hypothetical protein
MCDTKDGGQETIAEKLIEKKKKNLYQILIFFFGKEQKEKKKTYKRDSLLYHTR